VPGLNALLLATTLLLGWTQPAELSLDSKYRVYQRDKLVIDVRPLTAQPVRPADSGPPQLKIDRNGRGSLDLELLWPTADARCALRLEGRQVGSLDGESWLVELTATLQLADGSRVRSDRSLRLQEASTSLFEIYRLAGQVLTVALSGHLEQETVVPGPPSVGAPVQFELDVQRVIEGQAVTVETNLLNSLVGEPVTYSFKLGERGESDTVMIRLRAVEILGDVAEIEVAISGMLPGPEGMQLVSRTEQWFSSRQSTSTAALEAGDPPTGYRFLVTPRF